MITPQFNYLVTHKQGEKPSEKGHYFRCCTKFSVTSSGLFYLCTYSIS